jgi:GxxExxY protein
VSTLSTRWAPQRPFTPALKSLLQRRGRPYKALRKIKHAKERPMIEDEIGRLIVDVAVQVHRKMGPGLLETVYESILAYELERRGLRIERQRSIAVTYEALRFDQGFRVDLLVEDKVIVELKCVEKLTHAHKKQLLTYLRLADKRLGYLLNFNEALMKDGITRIINALPDQTH